MSEKHKKASRLRWADVPQEERSRRMSVIAKKKQAMLTPKERIKIMKKVTKARLKKMDLTSESN